MGATHRSLLSVALGGWLAGAMAQQAPVAEESDTQAPIAEASATEDPGAAAPGTARLGAFEFFEFDSSYLNRAENTMRFDGFRVFGENWSVTADRAVADADELGLDSGQLRFDGSIRLQLDTASLEAESAVFVFENKRLVVAELSGDPVAFEDHTTPEDGAACGSATTLRYDDSAGTFEMRGGVSLTVGPYRTTGCDLIYYLGQEEFRTGPAQCDEPFRTTIVPEESAATACD